MKKLILLIIVLAICLNLVKIQKIAYAQPDYGTIYNSDVILYATSWCGYCAKMRDFLKKQGIPYIEFDIEKSKKAYSEYKSLGGRGVPLVLVKGVIVSGYNPIAVIDAYRR